MAILRKSSAVSRSSGHSNDTNHADVLIDNLNKTFNKSIQDVRAINPPRSCRNSEKRVMPISYRQYTSR